MADHDMNNLEAKLDKVLAAHIFDQVEVQQIKSAVAFAEAFENDPDELIKIRTIYRHVSGWITVTSKISVAIAFIVFFWTQWDRLMDLLGTNR